jgi:hypothetical protein
VCRRLRQLKTSLIEQRERVVGAINVIVSGV